MGMKILELAKKLALWHTPTFRPIISHDDLEPILFSVGFISLPAYVSPPSTTLEEPSSPPTNPPAEVQWKEYAFPSAAAAVAAASGIVLPRPRLPFPMICGLHLIAYMAFLNALECYIDPSAVSDLFHVRAMPIHPLPDEDFEKTYRPMKDIDMNDGRLYVYRKGIYCCMHEQIAVLERRAETEEEGDNDHRIRRRSGEADEINIVSLENILPQRCIVSRCASPESGEY